MNKRVIAAALIGSTGGLVFGYDLGALSAVSESVSAKFHLSPALFGLTISFSLWGTVLGSILAGRIADHVERKKLISSCSLLYAIAAIGITQPVRSEWILFLAMRFLCGMAIGGLTVVCPLYLAELAPKDLRGRLVGLFQVQVGVGVVIGFSVGLLSARLLDINDVWKWCLGGGVIPASTLFLLLLFSPRGANADSSESQIEGRTNRMASAREGHPGPERLFRRKYLRPILLATSIAVFNQLSGVNVLLLYMLGILTSAGISLSLGHTYTVLISCFNLGTTLLGMAFVDKVGRKASAVCGIRRHGDLFYHSRTCSTATFQPFCLRFDPRCIQRFLRFFPGDGGLGLPERTISTRYSRSRTGVWHVYTLDSECYSYCDISDYATCLVNLDLLFLCLDDAPANRRGVYLVPRNARNSPRFASLKKSADR